MNEIPGFLDLMSSRDSLNHIIYAVAALFGLPSSGFLVFFGFRGFSD